MISTIVWIPQASHRSPLTHQPDKDTRGAHFCPCGARHERCAADLHRHISVGRGLEVLTRHQRGSDQNEHAPISRSSAHVEEPVLRISKRLLSSRTFPRNVPVHSLPAHPTRPCPRSTHPAFQVRAPPSLRGQLRVPGPCCLTHTTQGTRPARPIRLICAPIARFAPLRCTRRAAHKNASTLPGSAMAVWRALRASV